MFRPSPSPAASGRTRSGPILFEKNGSFLQLISECCAVNVTDHRISWHFFVWLTFDVLWFVINFRDYHKQPSSKAFFSTINHTTFLHSYIMITERFVIFLMHKQFLGLIKETFSLWFFTNMSTIFNETFWYCHSEEITFLSVNNRQSSIFPW